MSLLDQLIPEPDLLELDHVDVAVPPARAWEVVRHGDLGRSSLTRALFTVRTLPSRLAGRPAEPTRLRLDDIVATDEPGFRLLGEEPGRELAVGAIGAVWKPDIPFRDVRDPVAFRAFAEPGVAKVAWALRVSPRGERDARVEFELRVATTDADAARAFRRYFRVIGPASHFIRRHLLATLARELGTPEKVENERPLPADELLPDADAQVTHGITVRATPEAIWPWLVQMGCRRAGWYSFDALDNAGVPSAREIHPELQAIAVGDRLPATPDGEDGFEVLRVEPPRVLVLGGLYDPRTHQLPFAALRPETFWQVTWAFVLEPLDTESTRLTVRARAAFAGKRLHAAWIRPVHHFMQQAQLRNLAARVEGRMRRDSARDVVAGLAGAAGMLADLATPFLRGVRSHWGLDEATAAQALPGDALVPEPRWQWTHGIEIDAAPDEVWPWVAQIGVGRGGFYSYQWLENLAGCGVTNAERVHPEWELTLGDPLVLHPKMPPLRIAAIERGRFLVAHGAPDEAARAAGRPWTAASWLFLVEPLEGGRTRLISRFRTAYSDDLATRLAAGPTLTEAVGFVMDRQMLRGVKERVERRRQAALALPVRG